MLRDVGVIGLMSHDVFAWDHRAEKNTENAPVYTVTMELVNFYRGQLARTQDPVQSRKLTVIHFHQQIRASYARAFGMDFPTQGLDEMTNNNEQAALRSMHDILPGRVKLFDRAGRNELVLTNFLTAKTILNDKELDQPLKNFDGDYDKEYKEIRIPFSPKVINLMEVDGDFIEKFSPYKQSEMLQELKRVGGGEMSIKDLSYIHEFHNLFAKAFCGKNNAWMSQDLPCQ